MENFNNWFNKPLDKDDVEIWFNANNMIPEKMELYCDFTISLIDLMNKTYLGFNSSNDETKIIMTSEDNTNHFKWCWLKTIDNFKKENIKFEIEGDHYDYFISFFKDIFYEEQNQSIRESLSSFFKELFDIEKTFTKADVDLLTDLYKTMEKNLVYP